MNKQGLVGAVVVVGILVLSVVLALAVGKGGGSLMPGSLFSEHGDTVGIVRIEGPIYDTGESSLFGGEALAQDIIDQLDSAADDPSIAAVVVRINSPGGSASASWEIAEAIRRVQAAGKPVVVSMGDTAASGGYWIAAAADYILATPSTLTGSIGAIIQTYNLEALYEKIGYRPEVIKSGQYKDIGSPNREMLPEERAMLQSLIDETYEQFIQVVAEGRGLDPARVREIADGRVISGVKAVELGLVDEIGDLYQACLTAADMAGIEGDPWVEELGRKASPLDMFFGLSSGSGLWGKLMGQFVQNESAQYIPELDAILVRPVRMR